MQSMQGLRSITNASTPVSPDAKVSWELSSIVKVKTALLFSITKLLTTTMPCFLAIYIPALGGSLLKLSPSSYREAKSSYMLSFNSINFNVELESSYIIVRTHFIMLSKLILWDCPNLLTLNHSFHTQYENNKNSFF